MVVGLIDSIGIRHGCFRTKGKWICVLQTQNKIDEIARINSSKFVKYLTYLWCHMKIRGFGRICQQHYPLLRVAIELSKYYTTKILLNN